MESFAHYSSPFVEIFDFHGNGIGHARNVVDAKPKIKNHPSMNGWFFMASDIAVQVTKKFNKRLLMQFADDEEKSFCCRCLSE